ncbi:pentatricopeptide repeat-containing protein At1g06140, mitochondrial-like [Camellia sinensis]|uniref:pentatricopeptide repeat-containing protein At1g06140, mitochondrial-like n=1 Tax=Camellia sinensis TaxID=4442 RepID=UPI0010366F91|nr:pentatricopeptide repeat-containing protein At1g06140, mitochondrial-like [Camellia sinensis]
MRTEGFSVDGFNLAFAIKSCIRLSILQDGKLVYCLAIKSGLDRDPYLVPALIDVYSDLGSLKDAHKLFEEIPEWNTGIWGSMMKDYLKSLEQTKVFELFSKMRTDGFELEPFTSECLVRACGNVSAGKEGKSVHGFCIKHNFMNSNYIYLQTLLVDMYLNCGLLDFGLRLFKEVSNKDVVLWTAIVLEAGFSFFALTD